MEITDFGVPVDVQAPPADETVDFSVSRLVGQRRRADRGGTVVGMDAVEPSRRVGCPPPLLQGRPRARRGRPGGGQAHRRRGAVARRRRPPGAAVRGARPQGRPRRDGARPRPRPAPGSSSTSSRPRRSTLVDSYVSLTELSEYTSHRGRRAGAARVGGGARRPGGRSPARRLARAHGALPGAAHPPAAAAEADDLLLPDVEAPRPATPTGTRCRSRSASGSWPGTPASGAPTPAGCCSSSPAPPGSTTGSGASRCSPTTRSRSRRSSTRCGSTRCRPTTRSSVRSSPGCCSSRPRRCGASASSTRRRSTVSEHVRLFVSFPEELVDRPMIYEVVKRFDVVPNIRRANVEAHSGWVILELNGAQDAARRRDRLPRRGRLHRQHHGRRRHRGMNAETTSRRTKSSAARTAPRGERRHRRRGRSGSSPAGSSARWRASSTRGVAPRPPSARGPSATRSTPGAPRRPNGSWPSCRRCSRSTRRSSGRRRSRSCAARTASRPSSSPPPAIPPVERDEFAERAWPDDTLRARGARPRRPRATTTSLRSRWRGVWPRRRCCGPGAMPEPRPVTRPGLTAAGTRCRAT